MLFFAVRAWGRSQGLSPFFEDRCDRALAWHAGRWLKIRLERLRVSVRTTLLDFVGSFLRVQPTVVHAGTVYQSGLLPPGPPWSLGCADAFALHRTYVSVALRAG